MPPPLGFLSFDRKRNALRAAGIPALERAIRIKFPKESHKFFGRPLKTKDFAEIDRLTMEGKIPDARGRKWNLKAPETGAFQGWTPRVVPKVNMPASKVDHQRIANQYDFDVKLIKGKDWIETLKVVDTIFKARGWNVPTPKAEGGLARILEV